MEQKEVRIGCVCSTAQNSADQEKKKKSKLKTIVQIIRRQEGKTANDDKRRREYDDRTNRQVSRIKTSLNLFATIEAIKYQQ